MFPPRRLLASPHFHCLLFRFHLLLGRQSIASVQVGLHFAKPAYLLLLHGLHLALVAETGLGELLLGGLVGWLLRLLRPPNHVLTRGC